LKNHYLALANEIYNNIKTAAETMSESINIVIRLMPSGDELDVELPVFTTGKELVGQLLGENLAPRTDPEGNPYVYEIISKVSNVRLEDEKTLYDAGIREGETLYFVPKLVAG
jgi:WXG100 protein secretion system (Wss), protein YukD